MKKSPIVSPRPFLRRAFVRLLPVAAVVPAFHPGSAGGAVVYSGVRNLASGGINVDGAGPPEFTIAMRRIPITAIVPQPPVPSGPGSPPPGSVIVIGYRTVTLVLNTVFLNFAGSPQPALTSHPGSIVGADSDFSTSTSFSIGAPGEGPAGIHYFGFRFTVGAQTNYGWASVEVLGNSKRIVDWAYEDSGDSIVVGQTVPEPSASVVIALAGVAAVTRRSRRARTDVGHS